MTAVTGDTGYDVIVAGRAAAGRVVAARLSEDGTRLVLRVPAQGSQRATPGTEMRQNLSSAAAIWSSITRRRSAGAPAMAWAR